MGTERPQPIDFDPARRSFLRTSAWGPVVLGLAPILATGCTSYPEMSGLKYFSNKEYAIIKAIAEAVVPPLEDMEVFLRRMDSAVATRSPMVQDDMRAGFLFLEHGSALLNLTFKRFSKLSLENRRKVLLDWLESDLSVKRMLAASMKNFLFFLYYTQESVWPVIGYGGPWVEPNEVIRP